MAPLLVVLLLSLLSPASHALDQLSLRRSLPSEQPDEALSEPVWNPAGRTSEVSLRHHAHFPLSLADLSSKSPRVGSRAELQDVRDLLPQYLGSIVPTEPGAVYRAGSLNWTGACMLENWASATWTTSSKRRHITLTVKVSLSAGKSPSQ